MLFTWLLSLLVVISADAGSPEGRGSLPDTCFPSIGCFSNTPPWTREGRRAQPPQHPDSITTSMYFYNNENKEGINFPIYPAVNLTGIPFDRERPTYVIFECFMSNASYPWVQALKDVLLNSMDGNIFVASYAMPYDQYEQAVGNARVVGKMAAQVIDETGADPGNVHFIGHCIGGQIAAYAAKYLAEMGKKVGRLTALDPSGPLFEGEEPMMRVSPEDADLVEVLHSDISWAGMASPSGHVDFYMNEGFNQPGCEPSKPQMLETCSHMRAHDYYIEALQKGCMSGLPAEVKRDSSGKTMVTLVNPSATCQNSICVPIGFGLQHSSARGIFKVLTNSASPYCEP